METIQKVRLTNFRNLSEQIIEFESNVNCICGNNGNGKTNLLEAIYFSVNKKSFRKKASFQQILSADSGKPEILSSMTVANKSDDTDFYSILWESDKYTCILNNQKKIRKPNLNCVFVSPFDSFSFHNESSFRRNLIDSFISRIAPEYKKVLSDYTKLLRQKNSLLKSTQHIAQIDAIDTVLAEKIAFIVKYRVKFISDINPYLKEIYHDIFSDSVTLELEIESKFVGCDANSVKNLLIDQRGEDLTYRVSRIGSNRDNLLLNFNGFNSIDFCSLGQQKMAYLSLLFAYINLFRYKFREFPIVLIDDVSGELDSIRLDLLIKYLFKADYQVILTTANKEFEQRLQSFGKVNLINVKDGYFH